MADSEYSFSLTTFSPTGKLGQIDYALQAVANGQTALGIKATNGVVIAVEKKLPSPLVDYKSNSKVHQITQNIGLTYAGIGADARVLIRKGRKKAQEYEVIYHEPIPVQQLANEVAAVMQEFTQSGGVRPFGVSVLIAGHDHNGYQLFQVDPSGVCFRWKAGAIGKNMNAAKGFLEKRYNAEVDIEDAIHTAILVLKDSFDGELTEKNFEIGVVKDSDGSFRALEEGELKDYLKEVE